jgi:hypothetical protein
MYEMEMVQMDLKVSFIYVDLDGKWSIWEITSFLYKLILKSLVFRGAMNSILVMLCTVQCVEYINGFFMKDSTILEFPVIH